MGIVQRTIAAVGLAITAPALLVSGLVIKRSSPGPVFFRADRVGCDSTRFTMYKLRTMHLGSATAGSITGGDDPRVFRAGRVLRSLKLDEIPQLVNVVRGEMAFVGPRPEAPDVVEKYYEPWMMETLTVPPGVVGPGSLGYFLEEDQIPNDPEEAERYYASTLLPRKLARDLVFIRGRSVGYQLELVLRTVLGIVGLEHLLRRRVEREETASVAILATVTMGAAGASENA